MVVNLDAATIGFVVLVSLATLEIRHMVWFCMGLKENDWRNNRRKNERKDEEKKDDKSK